MISISDIFLIIFLSAVIDIKFLFMEVFTIIALGIFSLYFLLISIVFSIVSSSREIIFAAFIKLFIFSKSFSEISPVSSSIFVIQEMNISSSFERKSFSNP